MYPAKNGDCFLISVGNENKKHILIDFGYVETYEKFLKNDLLEIAQRNEKISLMIVSHIDSDHISGAIKFIEDNNKDNIIEIEEIWFNSLRHLQINKENGIELEDSEKEILEREIALGKSFLKRANQSNVDKDEISIKQGSTLGGLILLGNYNWNGAFNHKAIIQNNETISLDNVNISVLSPNEEKLRKLEEIWIKELEGKKWNFSINENELFDDAYEFMQLRLDEESTIKIKEISKKKTENIIQLDEYIEKEYPVDKSVNNGSSIAVLLEYNKKKLLFLADAHPDIIYESLKNRNDNFFDLIKVSHHGSIKNMSNELASVLCSPRYLFSTNGVKNYHPDPQSIMKLIAANSTIKKQLYFNYTTQLSNLFESNDLRKKYNYNIVSGNGEKPIVINI